MGSTSSTATEAAFEQKVTKNFGYSLICLHDSGCGGELRLSGAFDRSDLENRIIFIIVRVQSGDARLIVGAGGVSRSVHFKSNQCIVNKESMKPGRDEAQIIPTRPPGRH